MAMVLSGAMMLERIGEVEVSERVRSAIERAFEAGHCLTPDIGGGSTTSEMTVEIIRELEGDGGGKKFRNSPGNGVSDWRT
jgi:isocitrate/isopropylmalate dehydrogenase